MWEDAQESSCLIQMTQTHKRVFAGGVSGGLWKNDDITDPSSSWTEVSGVPSNMNISCITVDPNNANIWYLGTGEQYTSGAAVGNGVYKTIDGGLNWTSISVDYIVGDLSKDIISVLAGVFYINDIIAWDTNGEYRNFSWGRSRWLCRRWSLKLVGLRTQQVYINLLMEALRGRVMKLPIWRII